MNDREYQKHLQAVENMVASFVLVRGIFKVAAVAMFMFGLVVAYTEDRGISLADGAILVLLILLLVGMYMFMIVSSSMYLYHHLSKIYLGEYRINIQYSQSKLSKIIEAYKMLYSFLCKNGLGISLREFETALFEPGSEESDS